MINRTNNKKISFRAKEKSVCPICKMHHHKETILQGGRRLISGSVTKELRRQYEISQTYGRVEPKDYSLMVCPSCLYCSYPKDWDIISENEIKELKQNRIRREETLNKILGPLDFNEDRNLVLGAASYLLAIDCYQLRNPNVAPTTKKAVSSLRSAWYFNDLHNEFKNLNFDKVRDYLYIRTAYWYSSSLTIIQDGSETFDSVSYMLGPDTDKNYNVDGVIYLSSFLNLKYCKFLEKDETKRMELLKKTKINISKIYGRGKSSKSKPTFILEQSKELYDELSKICDD